MNKKILIDKRDLNIPNALSFLRLLLIFPLMFFFSNLEQPNYRIYILFTLILIFISDNLDGYLARKFNQITDFGKMLDPLSDKIVVAFMVIFMFIYGEIPPIYFLIILAKDFYIYLGGIYLYKKTGIVPAANIYGKIAVASIGVFLVWSILDSQKDSPFYLILMFSSLLFVFLSLLSYTEAGINLIKRNNQRQL